MLKFNTMENTPRLITRAEWTRIRNLKPFIHYTLEEKQFLYNLAKEFVDPHLNESCASCTGGGDAKIKLYGWFNVRKETLLAQIEEKEAQDAQALAEIEVIDEPVEVIQEDVVETEVDAFEPDMTVEREETAQEVEEIKEIEEIVISDEVKPQSLANTIKSFFKKAKKEVDDYTKNI